MIGLARRRWRRHWTGLPGGRRHGIWLGLAVAGAGACASESRSPERTVVRDSAGIRITESHESQWGPTGGWRLADAPRTRIGVVDGPPSEQLFRVVDAALLSDGRIVVANAGTSEVRIYDPAGRALASTGGDGEGPGEFRRITAIDVGAGDSIYVWDMEVRRLSVLSPSGDFDRSIRLTPTSELSLSRYDGRFSDGSLLARVSVIVESSEIIDESVVESPGLYLVYDAAGAPLDTVGTFRGSRSMIKFLGPTPQSGISVISLAFDPATRMAIDGLDLYVGDGASFEVRRIGRDGSVRAIFRRIHEPALVTSDLLQREFERQNPPRTNQEDYLRRIREAYEAMPVGGAIPAYDRLLMAPAPGDEGGDVWVRHTDVPGDGPHAWSVFSSDGRWLGDVEMPRGLEVYEIGDGVVVGRERDELEVEHVVVYEIIRPG